MRAASTPAAPSEAALGLPFEITARPRSMIATASRATPSGTRAACLKASCTARLRSAFSASVAFGIWNAFSTWAYESESWSMSWMSFFRSAEAFSATACISASTLSKFFRPMVRFATISVNAAASAAFNAAELPPPGTGSPDAVLAR